MKNVLVMWSAGIDSTYTLAWLLKNTTDYVHAHHLNITYHPTHPEAPRYLLEKAAGEVLMPKLKQIREFTVSLTHVDQSAFTANPFDMYHVCVHAGLCARNFCNHPDLTPFTYWTIGTHKKEGHWQNRWDFYEPAMKAACWPYDAPTFKLLDLATKEEESKFLDELGLLKDCWYCRTPKEDKACGVCKTCKEVAKINPVAS